MGWTLLGAGLLLALYTLLRHGLRRSPPLRDRPELRGRTAIVTGERRERTAPGRKEGREGGRKGGRARPRAHRYALCSLSAGGSSGIGAATALELARCGARVVLATRNAPRGEAAARRIRTVRAAAPATAPARTPPLSSRDSPAGRPRVPSGGNLG